MSKVLKESITDYLKIIRKQFKILKHQIKSYINYKTKLIIQMTAYFKARKKFKIANKLTYKR